MYNISCVKVFCTLQCFLSSQDNIMKSSCGQCSNTLPDLSSYTNKNNNNNNNNNN